MYRQVTWRVRRRAGWALALLLALISGCAVQTAPSAGGVAGSSPQAATCVGNGCTPATGVSNVSLFVEPDAGEAPVVHAIEGATHSIDLEAYLLTDRNVIDDLENAANRGIAVRVLLELHPYGGGATSAAQTVATLDAAGVHAQGGDPAYHYTHEKAMVIDGATAFIMTCNLTRSGLGGSSAAANREYGIIDTHTADVNEVEAIFNADWNRTTPTLTDPSLVVSPVNARQSLGTLIAAAHASLLIEDEEMYDTQSEDDLIAAAQRGVRVEVVLPAPSGGSSSGASDVARLQRGGVGVRYLRAPYMHAKLIVADGVTAFVGSENFSATSLDENREVGILIGDSGVVSALTHVFQLDWSAATNA